TDKSFDYEAITATSIFPDASALLTSKSLTTTKATNIQSNSPQFLAYAPAQTVAGLPELKWQAILATDTSLVYAPQQKLRLVLIWGSAAVAIGVGAIAYALANRLLRPILLAANAVREIGQGNFSTQINIVGTDEIAQLGGNINRMATQLADFVQVQTILAQQSEEIKNIALQLANSDSHQEILAAVVQGSFQAFKAERVVYYQFTPQSATAVAESIAPGQKTLQNSSLSPELVAEYQERSFSQVEAINNLAQADLTAAKREYLESLGIKSCLIAPVMIEQQLDGLLMVHQSFTPLPWLDEEVEFITQITNQIDFALTRLKLNAQQKLAETREKSAKEAMQMRALSLLQEVYDVSEGDLTIRARVTEDEIGTIADSYNSTIESLQSLVKQTKAAAADVELNTVANDAAVQSLAAETVAQAEAIANMLQQIESMETSITLVANQANQAEEFVQQATTTIAHEDRAMNRTVAEIKAVQHTV
ncbi:MAG: HAMP domain-containing protein, partial [Cyanobacteria bacterium J06553_1]